MRSGESAYCYLFSQINESGINGGPPVRAQTLRQGTRVGQEDFCGGDNATAASVVSTRKTNVS